MQKKKISDVLSRPHVDILDILKIVPRETYFNYIQQGEQVGSSSLESDFMRGVSLISGTDNSGESAYQTIADNLCEMFPGVKDAFKLPYEADIYRNQSTSATLSIKEIIESAEILIKYRGYIEREKRIADKILKLEDVIIPENYDFASLKSLSIESRQKLEKHRPKNISQASRIPGVSPSDISVLLVCFGR